MNTNEAIDRLLSIKQLSELKPDDIRKVHKMMLVENILSERDENPNINLEQIAKKMNVSVSKIQRTRQDLSLPSFFRYDVPMKSKSTKSKLMKHLVKE